MSFSLEDLNWDQIMQRLMRIIQFDEDVWEEIEYDEEAETEAAAVVVIAALLSALGAAIARASVGVFILQLLSVIAVSWLLWSAVTMLVGTQLFDAQTDFREMIRMLGYANAPLALGILSPIPCLGAIIGLVGSLLALVLGFLALRQALALDTGKTIITIIIGWFIVFIVSVFIGIGGIFL